jgi:hypothetical protein
MPKYLWTITKFSEERNARGGGMIICVKKYMACMRLWADEDFEMMAVEVKGRDATFTWEIIGIYRAPKGGMRVTERLATPTHSLGKSKKKKHNWR